MLRLLPPSRLLMSCAVVLTAATAFAADWPRFRGPGGLGKSDATGLPVKWSESENLVWKVKLPGPGTSSPITVGDAIFLTCYGGYGESPTSPGDQSNLVRHVVCLDRKTGKQRWDKEVKAELSESNYSSGNNGQHGYAASTPASDGERVYAFFGKSGVYCFDLAGKELWHTRVGTGTTGWGSATSPLVTKDLVIVNASVEDRALVGLDKMTGKQKWRTGGVSSAWCSPTLVEAPGGKTEVVLNLPRKLVGYDPETGKELWSCPGFPDGYICPSVVAHDGIIYAIGGRTNPGALAVKPGGRGEVKPLWTASANSRVPSPIYHEGHLYWVNDQNGMAYCLDAATGEEVYRERLARSGSPYASGVLAEGRVYYVLRDGTTVVVAAKPKFEVLAQNKLDDPGRTNASPAVDAGRLLIRSDKYLYCVGTK